VRRIAANIAKLPELCGLVVGRLQKRSANLSRPPQIGPCAHTIRGDDL